MIAIPNTQLDDKAQYFIDGATHTVHELLSVTDGVPRSWLIGDTVQQGV